MSPGPTAVRRGHSWHRNPGRPRARKDDEDTRGGSAGGSWHRYHAYSLPQLEEKEYVMSAYQPPPTGPPAQDPGRTMGIVGLILAIFAV